MSSKAERDLVKAIEQRGEQLGTSPAQLQRVKDQAVSMQRTVEAGREEARLTRELQENRRRR